MNPPNPSPFRRLTSVAPAADRSEQALTRAQWLQRQGLSACALVARDIIGTDDQAAKQEALCADLERLAVEARGLLEHLQTAGR